MTRLAPWLLLTAVLFVVACAGGASTAVGAAAWSLDGSRAWWMADARAAALALAGTGVTLGVVVVLGVVGAVLVTQSAAPTSPPAKAP